MNLIRRKIALRGRIEAIVVSIKNFNFLVKFNEEMGKEKPFLKVQKRKPPHISPSN